MARRSPLPRTVRIIPGTQANEDLLMWLETGLENLRAGIRADVHAELKALDDRWNARMAAMDEKWNARIVILDDKWNARISALDEKQRERIHQVDRHVGEAKADLMRWSFVFGVGAVAAVAALAGVLGAP